MIDNLIECRLEKFISTKPKSMQVGFKNYYTSASWDTGIRFFLSIKDSQVPFWYKLPIIIEADTNNKFGLAFDKKKILQDSLWAQYCIFMHIRIKDDVIDLDTDDKDLILISDLFRIECEETLAKYFDHNNNLWSTYYQLLKETTTAMYKKENIEKQKIPSTIEILKQNGLESSILNIGTAAICFMYGKTKEFLTIKQCVSYLVISSQIINDLNDFKKDLKRGNKNYVAARLMEFQNFKGDSTDEILEQITNYSFNSKQIEMIINDAFNYITKAELEAAPLNLIDLENIIDEFKIYINSIKESFVQKRAEKFLFAAQQYLSRNNVEN